MGNTWITFNVFYIWSIFLLERSVRVLPSLFCNSIWETPAPILQGCDRVERQIHWWWNNCAVYLSNFWCSVEATLQQHIQCSTDFALPPPKSGCSHTPQLGSFQKRNMLSGSRFLLGVKKTFSSCDPLKHFHSSQLGYIYELWTVSKQILFPSRIDSFKIHVKLFSNSQEKCKD